MVNTVRTKPKEVVNDYIEIPQDLKDTHQNIEIFIAFMYIQVHTYLVTISKKIISITIQ